MNEAAYYIFLGLMGGILLLIAVGMSIRTWYWRRKIAAIKEDT